jgi:GntR family transcriptional regulator
MAKHLMDRQLSDLHRPGQERTAGAGMSSTHQYNRIHEYMRRITRNSPTPLYYQLKQLVAARIAEGEWQPGNMLPTEEQLEEQYGLSRTTVRQGLRELELEGKIIRFRGRGTFVARPKISHSPEPHFSLTDSLIEQGASPGWQLLSEEWVPAPDDVAQLLSLEVGTPVFRLCRLRLDNDEPIGYHVAHAAPVLARAINREWLEQGGSLAYLQASDILQNSYANRVVEAIPASDEVAALLGTDRGSPMLLIRRRIMGGGGEPLELLRAIYRGDRLQYHIRRAPLPTLSRSERLADLEQSNDGAS